MTFNFLHKSPSFVKPLFGSSYPSNLPSRMMNYCVSIIDNKRDTHTAKTSRKSNKIAIELSFNQYLKFQQVHQFFLLDFHAFPCQAFFERQKPLAEELFFLQLLLGVLSEN